MSDENTEEKEIDGDEKVDSDALEEAFEESSYVEDEELDTTNTPHVSPEEELSAEWNSFDDTKSW